jgi:toxin CcdB
MAQFDVHRNPGRQLDSIPFVVVVQSSIFEEYPRRVVVPLVNRARLKALDEPGFNPVFTVNGLRVVLHPLEIVSIPVDRLGPVVTTLADQGDRIVEALDRLLTRAYR